MSRTRLFIVAAALLGIIALVLFFAPSNHTAMPRDNADTTVLTMPQDDFLMDSMGGATALQEETATKKRIAPEGVPAMIASEPVIPQVPGAPSEDPHVITNAYVEAQVNALDIVSTRIEQTAVRYSGQVMSRNFNKDDNGMKSGTMVVKVPSQNFQDAYQEIKKLVTFLVTESTSAVDVTEDYIDLEARLANKKKEEAAIAAILARAENVEETLDVTTELARVRGEIERLEGRMRYMNAQTQYATITLRLSEDPGILASDTWHPTLVAKDAMHTLITRLQRIVNHTIAFTIESLPLMVAITLVAIIVWRVGRRVWRALQERIS